MRWWAIAVLFSAFAGLACCHRKLGKYKYMGYVWIERHVADLKSIA